MKVHLWESRGADCFPYFSVLGLAIAAYTPSPMNVAAVTYRPTGRHRDFALMAGASAAAVKTYAVSVHTAIATNTHPNTRLWPSGEAPWFMN